MQFTEISARLFSNGIGTHDYQLSGPMSLA